jgi:hypothetical protein
MFGRITMSDIKKMKKDLLKLMKLKNNNKFIIQALDGLFLVNNMKPYDDRISSLKNPIEGLEINRIDMLIKDIIICSGAEGQEPIVILNDIDYIEAKDIMVINVIPASKAIEKGIVKINS